MQFILAKKTLIAAGAALVLGAATLGVVLAQQAPTATPAAGQRGPHMQAYLDSLAKQLGITTDRLQQAMTAARTELGWPARGAHPGPKPGGMGHRPGGPGAMGMGAMPQLAATANAIGITVDALRQELPGKSLADVARAHGKNPTDVANTLKSAANERIDQAAAQGRFDPNQAKQRIAAAIDAGLNRVVPQGRGDSRPERGPRGASSPRTQQS